MISCYFIGPKPSISLRQKESMELPILSKDVWNLADSFCFELLSLSLMSSFFFSFFFDWLLCHKTGPQSYPLGTGLMNESYIAAA